MCARVSVCVCVRALMHVQLGLRKHSSEPRDVSPSGQLLLGL